MKQIPMHVIVWLGATALMLLSGLAILGSYALTLSRFFFIVSYCVFAFSAIASMILAWLYGYARNSVSRREFRYAIGFVTVSAVIALFVTLVTASGTFSWLSVFPAIVFVIMVVVGLLLIGRLISDNIGTS